MTENPPKDAPDKTEYHAKCKQAKSLDKPRLTRGLLLLYDKLVNKCVWCDHQNKTFLRNFSKKSCPVLMWLMCLECLACIFFFFFEVFGIVLQKYFTSFIWCAWKKFQQNLALFVCIYFVCVFSWCEFFVLLFCDDFYPIMDKLG